MLRARRDARAKSAKAFINKTIPEVLRRNARARQGIANTTVIVNPAKAVSPSTASVTFRVCDTLLAAEELAQDGSRVAILNMASPLRPGGGVLTGATSQEESLCSRTTLYPSLREEFYRLPDVGGVYTPDVLVLNTEQDLAPRERFYVDVVSAGMLRMPDVQGGRYVEDKDREMAVCKMRAVMRMARQGGVNRLVLGAWGCGAYGNPTAEIARAWKKVLTGGKRGVENAEGWQGLQVVFAIKERRLADVFADEFGIDLDPTGEDSEDSEDRGV